MKKNQLNAFRKRMQKSVDSFVRHLTKIYLSSSESFCNVIVDDYHHYCKKMLFCTIVACVFNVIFAVIFIFCIL